MNTFAKILIGVLTGVGAVWSLGGFDSMKSSGNKNGRSPEKQNSTNNFNDYQGDLLNDDGPDATDCDNSDRNCGRYKESQLVSDVRNIQDTFTKFRNILDFVISVGTSFLKLFGNNSAPQTRVQPSVIIY